MKLFREPKLKAILAALLIAGLGLVSAGCTGKSNQTGVGTNELITLTWWRPIDDYSVMEPLIKSFEQQYRNVKINYVKKDPATYEIDSLNALATTDQGPDIWSIPNDWITRQKNKLVAAPKGLLIPAEVQPKDNKKSDKELFADIFPKIAVDQLVIDDKVYGIPLSIDDVVLFYNPALIDKTIERLRDAVRFNPSEQAQLQFQDQSVLLRDPPKTWNDFIEQIKLITVRDGNQITTAGTALGTANNIPHATDLVSLFMLQNGTQMTNKEHTEATFNQPQKDALGQESRPGTAALEFYSAFANPGREVYSWNPDQPSAFQAFAEGKVAMIFGYADDEKTLKNLAPTLNYQIAPIPQISSTATVVDKVAYGRYYAETVTKNSKNSKAAWAFLDYMADPGALSSYQATSGRPPSDKQKGAGSPFGEQLNFSTTWDHGPEPVKTNESLDKMIQELVLGKVNAQTAIDTAAAEITNTMRPRL